MAGTLLAIFQTRLELLSNEAEEERLRVGQMLLYGSVALFLFGLSIMLLTVFIVVLFWGSHRLLVLGGLSALFFIACVEYIAPRSLRKIQTVFRQSGRIGQ